MEDIYIKAGDAYINLMWSSNPPADEKATGVIGIYVYDADGGEHPEKDGGEMDVFDDKLLTEHISDALEFIGCFGDYEIISEDEFPV